MVQKDYNKKILIICSNFYPEISDNLLKGAIDVLKKNKYDFVLVNVTGSLEIPFFLEKYKNKFLGYVVLGCVIRGETDHYEVVKKITIKTIYKIAYENMLPLSTSLLTVYNYSDALERASVNKKNLGGVAANACIELINKLNEK